MIKFGIKSFYDPYGDGKSERKKFGIFNYHSELSMDEVLSVIKERNGRVGYYQEQYLVAPDGRKKESKKFKIPYYGV